MFNIITGDSYGADSLFTNKFIKSNINVYNVTHQVFSKLKGKPMYINKNQLDIVEDKCNVVRGYMGTRSKQHNEYILELLNKCFYQVNKSDIIFLIGKFNNHNISMGSSGYMTYYNKFFLKKPMIIYDQEDCHWYIYNEDRKGFCFDRYKKFPRKIIEENFKYCNLDNITCSGLRTINQKGKRAIGTISGFIINMKVKYG